MLKLSEVVAVLPVLAFAAAEPTPFAAWFGVDYSSGYAANTLPSAWSDASGSWTLSAPVDPDAICTFVAAAQGVPSHVELNALTNGWLSFSPSTPAVSGTLTEFKLRVSMYPHGFWEQLPDLAAEGGRAGVLVMGCRDGVNRYCGWSLEGWTVLEGAVPSDDDFADVTISIDESTLPAKVSYSVAGVRLVAATNSAVATFPCASSSVSPSVGIRGIMKLAAFGAECELPERTAAVVHGNATFDYYRDVAAALAAATAGDEVQLLKRAQIVAGDIPEGASLVIAPRLASPALPPIEFTGQPVRELTIRPPDTWTSGAPIAAPATAIDGIHVHGTAGTVYTLTPDDKSNSVLMKKGAIDNDAGNFVGWISMPFHSRIFLGGVSNAMLGSLHTLYVQGKGSLCLCGDNSLFTGTNVVERGTLRYCSPQSAPPATCIIEKGLVPAGLGTQVILTNCNN